MLAANLHRRSWHSRVVHGVISTHARSLQNHYRLAYTQDKDPFIVSVMKISIGRSVTRRLPCDAFVTVTVHLSIVVPRLGAEQEFT
jgi:5-carboxymethyl-2-hydroxymuconate isomerase